MRRVPRCVERAACAAACAPSARGAAHVRQRCRCPPARVFIQPSIRGASAAPAVARVSCQRSGDGKRMVAYGQTGAAATSTELQNSACRVFRVR